MSVDPTKQRKIIVVHGVQTGEDEDQNQHESIADLIASRLGNSSLDFITQMYRYENINDRAQNKFKRLVRLIAGTPVNRKIASSVIDLVGDVVISLSNGSTAAKIRKGLKEEILQHFTAGNPCYVVAHSLGSIYAFDVINELMKDSHYFDRGSRRSWPVQGLVTLGSPIGLGMFRAHGRRSVTNLGQGTKWFRWKNFWDRTDPVVSGSIFGRQINGYDIAERYRRDTPDQGWVIRDVPIDTGKVWLMSHVAYWEHPLVGDVLVDMVTN
jgi:hypothetical protein